MLQELTFVDSVLLITVFDLAAVRDKFSSKNTPSALPIAGASALWGVNERRGGARGGRGGIVSIAQLRDRAGLYFFSYPPHWGCSLRPIYPPTPPPPTHGEGRNTFYSENQLK
jgi:hypothetical protein